MTRFIIFLIVIAINIVSSFAQIQSEEILIKNNAIELPGALTFSNKKQPLIIWVHGSGNIDRNGNQKPVVKANYIKQFRDSITKQGIAFFSYDKRTSNLKNKDEMLKKGVVFTDFVSDITTVINYFKTKKEFSKIILVGHSQGSLIAMLASKNVDKVISLAGPSVSADDAIVKQINERGPMLDSIIRAHFKELKATGKIKTVHPMLISLLHQKNQPFIKSWMQYNPSKEIKKVNIPVLIINGTEDLQVKVNDAKELHAANPKSKLVIIEKMNHVLKEVNSITENQSSYYSADFPLSKKLITTVVNFVKQ